LTVVIQQRPVLALSDIWKSYPGVAALKGVSFEASAGQVHALLGENGAGKSTLMGVAAASIMSDAGTISIDGEEIGAWSPSVAKQSGLAIVYQHPALLPDMTVAENLAIALPEELHEQGGSARAWMTEQLERIGCHVRLGTRVDELSVAQRQLIEIAKALAFNPRVLILDEPTAPLGVDMVERMFEQVRAAAARDAAIVYISHRLPEVRQIADVVTVMRDGEVRATAPLEELSDEEILNLIIGRTVSMAFPPKRVAGASASAALTVEGLTARGFEDVSLHIEPGEIVGLAGIAGNGQSDVLRALAGLEPASGTVRLGDRDVPLGRSHAAHDAGVAYLSADRHHEGLQMTLSVRENAALSALPQFSSHGIVNRRTEVEHVERQREALDIRTASLDTTVASLSGGNQQKVGLARALLTEPRLLLADEPTQGVDAGARVEIYRILRETAAKGVPIMIVSSDGVELQGLCDRILVFSRGQVIEELAGDDVSEERMARSIVTATTHRRQGAVRAGADAESRGERIRRFAKGDYVPAAILLLVIVLFGIYTWSVNDRVLNSFNLTSMLTLLAALAFISLGQLAVIMTGGIDISVGPLAGLTAVIASFFVVQGKSTGTIVLGFAIMLGAAAAVGLLNGTLVRFGGFTSIAATLTTSIALQGVSLLLRPEQGGFIKQSVSDVVQKTVGVVPVAFIVAIVLAIVLEYGLRRRKWGLRLRAAGSSERAAHQLGVHVDRTVVGAYVACSVLTFLGGVMLMAQLGVGSPTEGVSYTLSSITAVVLGGASLFGGRGSFIGALLGAALIQQIVNATTFLSLSQAWQYWLTGLLTLGAAAIYTRARHAGKPA
jgi:ribose transport system ATP-binding protein